MADTSYFLIVIAFLFNIVFGVITVTKKDQLSRFLKKAAEAIKNANDAADVLDKVEATIDIAEAIVDIEDGETVDAGLEVVYANDAADLLDQAEDVSGIGEDADKCFLSCVICQ
ncbi:hypothetical protein J1N35_003813 [Gossypium stocksii]|uniref:Uncharacterized protein n=1 Tax=Gossypium stocksii TaxID=47602 RepID=A0A9D3WCF9_9ROSI|nr:hypothetical protein J1N35_003813 [Gossypium stocksii]